MRNKKFLILLIAGVLLFVGCGKTKEEYNGKVFSFSYSFGSYFDGYCDYNLNLINNVVKYTAYCNGNDKSNIEKEVDKSYLDEIEKIIKDNNIADWNEFNKSDDDILDGYGFSLEIGYSDGKNIIASGYMKYPDNYDEVHQKIVEFLTKLNKA